MVPGLVAFAFILALLASRRASASTPADARAALAKIVASEDPRKLAAAAVAAKQAGQPQLAAALVVKAKSAAAGKPDALYPSPFLQPNDQQWNKFVRTLRGPDPKAITPAHYLGMFGFGMRKLVDLGLAKNPTQKEYNGRKVWVAEWVPPLTLDKFLGDANLQYQAFVKAMTADAAWIKKHAPELIGSTLDGKQVTMSGLLGVSKQAGVSGMMKWATDAKIRSQHPQTTAQFNKVNGIF